jgi:small subunit ribosomal protein S21
LKTQYKSGIILIVVRREGQNLTKVVVRNGNIDGALKKFKQKVAKSGLPSECKKREHYSKPGIQRREAKKAGIKNSRKRQSRERD